MREHYRDYPEWMIEFFTCRGDHKKMIEMLVSSVNQRSEFSVCSWIWELNDGHFRRSNNQKTRYLAYLI
jgi:hypothetical protein